ncbi:MAG: glycosyltransferase, partial [Candidatus Cloacimonetes bacterium]|nr:glycosyltransferase [Candidatus Cloacimonadota bacterium]
MKIFYIDPNNTTPQYNYPLVEKLNEEGVQTVFFTSKNEKFVNYYEKIYSIAPNYWFFKFENKIKIKKLRKFVKMFLYPIQNIRLFLKIKKEKPQIIHYNWLAFPFIDFFMINKISRLGIKIILSVHDYKQHDRQKLRVLEKKVFDRVDGIICLSEFVKSQFPKKLQTKIIVIQHGNCYEKELKNLKITTKKSDNFSLLMIGNIKPYKGAEILIDAVNSLSKSNIKLEICGRCNYQQKLVERAKNPNIYFDFGFVE